MSTGRKKGDEQTKVDREKEKVKELFKKPSTLPVSKAPTGKGLSKNDILVQRLANEFHHDPIAELVKLAKSSRVMPETKVKINLELLSYYMPKLKAIDTNPNQGETISLNIILPSQTKSFSSPLEASVIDTQPLDE